jgi:hypothetical protein
MKINKMFSIERVIRSEGTYSFGYHGY